MSQQGFPVKGYLSDTRNYDVLRNESRRLYPSVITSKGNLTSIGAGQTTNLDWHTVTPPTITANSWVAMTNIEPTCGRKFVFKGIIEVDVSGDCFVSMKHEFVGTDIQSGTFSSVVGTFLDYVAEVKSTNKAVFDFRTNPLIVKYGERISFNYYSKSTTGVVWCISLGDAFNLTNDDSYDANNTIVLFGDSIMITSENRAPEYVKREDGTITGQTGFILKKKFEESDKSVRLVNMCIAGTNAPQWDLLFNNGQFNSIKGSLGILNIGMNDSSTNAGLSTAVGIDGFFKKALKNIVRQWFAVNPDSGFILDSITATDDAGRTANISVSSGQAGFPYNGISRIVAYRNEIQQVVNELQPTYPKLVFADTSTAYNISELAFTDSAPKVHANNTLGHPRIANIIFPVASSLNVIK